jgi:hypothetical protein
MQTGKTFRLGGKDYRLSKADIEHKMRNIPPKPLGKYRVQVNGIDYPPKQVIAESLGKSLVTFTTMDAARILSSIGFEVRRAGEYREPPKTESERLFEEYLSLSGLSDFQFEKQFPGKTRLPDYSVKLADGNEVLFEVKEFRATTEDFRPGGGAYDPYVHIREKIDQAREKFKEFKEYCCCLVMFNREKPLVDLSWQFVYGAMLGNLGFRVPVNTRTGVGDEEHIEQTFMCGGKMLRYRGLQPTGVQNQTISAMLTLDLLPVGRIRFDRYVEELEKQRGSELDLENYSGLIDESRGTERDTLLTQLRGVLHENPEARIHFPFDLFRGPYDERYGARDGRIQRLYAGPGLERLGPKFTRSRD